MQNTWDRTYLIAEDLLNASLGMDWVPSLPRGTAQLIAGDLDRCGMPRCCAPASHATLPMPTQLLTSCASYHPMQPVAEGR